MKNDKLFYEGLSVRGVSRRYFMKYCTTLATVLGVSTITPNGIAKALASSNLVEQRDPIIWLNFSQCDGCTGAFFKTQYPCIDEIILEILSIEYHESMMAASGFQAENQLSKSVEKYDGNFICVVEGAVGTNYNGGYGKVAGKSFLDIASEVCGKAKAVISMGTCAAYGGLSAAAPNPGGYKGVSEATGVPTLNIPGCPPNPVNLIGTIVHYLLLGRLPELDKIGRPMFAYGKSIHDQCPRLSHFENEEFVEEFGSEEASKGYCLYKVGCKGPDTYNNCPIVKFNDGTSWPVEAGHPCIGCSEPNFWDAMTPFYEENKIKNNKVKSEVGERLFLNHLRKH